MVRAPCCEKMGVKKGPWTPEEDRILVSYIQRFGHGNWRALPKEAGLLRCGKSCRLRWINYLRPDIKRGNFTKEEEETVLKLHQVLGNRWSAIAARLPGRTDNDIKNYWNSHLKKRSLKQSLVTKGQNMVITDKKENERTPLEITTQHGSQQYPESSSTLPQQPEADFGLTRRLNPDKPVEQSAAGLHHHLRFPFSHVLTKGSSNANMEFWYNLLNEAETELHRSPAAGS